MERPGNQHVRSIEPRCDCAHENGRWVTRFTVIHDSFDCVEPLTDVVHRVGSEETQGLSRSCPCVVNVCCIQSDCLLLLAASLFLDLRDCSRATSLIRWVTWWNYATAADASCRRSRNRGVSSFIGLSDRAALCELRVPAHHQVNS
jgi:hypothetical protein